MCDSAFRERSKHRYSKWRKWRIVFTWVILTCLDLVLLGLSRSDLTWLDLIRVDLTWLDKYYYCYYRHDVVWARVTLSYHITSYVLLFYLFCWFDLHSILFYSILLYFKLIRFDLILFYFILLNLIYYIVQYSISYQWMICVNIANASHIDIVIVHMLIILCQINFL